MQADVKYRNADEYIALQPEHMRETLETLRQTIKNAVPEAIELISYQMVGYKYHGMLAYFAAFKNHYGLYINPEFLLKFKDRLKEYKLAKATIQFPINKPIPENLIAEMMKYIAGEKLRKKLEKETTKNKTK